MVSRAVPVGPAVDNRATPGGDWTSGRLITDGCSMVRDDQVSLAGSEAGTPRAETPRAILGAGCKLRGEMTLEGDALLLGSFQGTLRVYGTLEIGPAGNAGGSIRARRIRLAGAVDAATVAEEEMDLLPGGRLHGTLVTPS